MKRFVKPSFVDNLDTLTYKVMRLNVLKFIKKKFKKDDYYNFGNDFTLNEFIDKMFKTK